MKSIPASRYVSVIPSVLGTGGNPLSLNAVILTANTAVPVGTAPSFPDLASVEAYFGADSIEAQLAGVYFQGFSTANTLPSALLFWQYVAEAVAGYLRGGKVSGLTLSQLQAFSGSLTLEVDGRTITGAATNLSSATSFSNAATLIQAGLQTAGGAWTGTITTVDTNTTVTVDTTSTGQIAVGDTIVSTNLPGATTVESFGTYTPELGTGTIVVSAAATASAGPTAATIASAVTVSYNATFGSFVITSPTTGADSSVAFPTTGTFATDLKLTAATGAILSPGSAIQTPAATMDALVGVTQDWATFMLTYDPDSGTEPATVKLAFSAWTSTANVAGSERFCFAGWDTDPAPAAGTAAASFGAAVTAAGYNGTVPIWDIASDASNPGTPGTTIPGAKAAFFCGATASIDYTETQGRISYDYKSQAGLVADVVDDETASNLIANGYNFYGAVATAAQGFVFFQPGSMPGSWVWADDYIDQIWLNSAFQLSILSLLTTVKSIPYNNAGYALLRAACMGPINAALNAGVIQPGVPLSPSQAQEVNTAAGLQIDGVLSTVGWYLQILPASATTRGTRGSPPMTFWYTDGGSVQQVTLASIDVQ